MVKINNAAVQEEDSEDESKHFPETIILFDNYHSRTPPQIATQMT